MHVIIERKKKKLCRKSTEKKQEKEKNAKNGKVILQLLVIMFVRVLYEKFHEFKLNNSNI